MYNVQTISHEPKTVWQELSHRFYELYKTYISESSLEVELSEILNKQGIIYFSNTE